MSIAEKICSIYKNAIYEGKSCYDAYWETRIAARKECCNVEWVDEPNKGGCRSIIYTFLDYSSCYLSYSDCRE